MLAAVAIMAAASQLSEQTVVCPARQRRRARRLGVRSCSPADGAPSRARHAGPLAVGQKHALSAQALEGVDEGRWHVMADGPVRRAAEVLHIFSRDKKQMNAEAMPIRRCSGMSDSGLRGRRWCLCWRPVGGGTALGWAWGGSCVRTVRGTCCAVMCLWPVHPTMPWPMRCAHSHSSQVRCVSRRGAHKGQGSRRALHVRAERVCGPFVA